MIEITKEQINPVAIIRNKLEGFFLSNIPVVIEKLKKTNPISK